MIKSKRQRAIRLHRALILTAVTAVFAVMFNSALAAGKPKGDVVSEILARQETKGDELNVYLRDAKRVYVNGKQISLNTLATVVRQSRTKRAIVTPEPQVTRERVKEVKELIQKSGLKDIKLSAPKQRTDDRPRDKPRNRENSQSRLNAGVLQVLARQEKKGDELNVYLRDAKRIYVNGTQISLNMLPTVVRQSRTKRAIVTSEPQVTHERVKEVKELIQKSGLKDIKLSAPMN